MKLGLSLPFLKYVIVGIGHNGLGYLAYLTLTSAGAPPLGVVAVLYPLGVSISFWLNKTWSFNHKGDNLGTLMRFLASHLAAYCLQIILLAVMIEVFVLPHQLAQLLVILTLAVFLYLMFKYYVITPTNAPNRKASSIGPFE